MNKNQEKPQPTEQNVVSGTNILDYAAEVIVAIVIYAVGVFIFCL
jgi:hypothetical protein